MDNTKDSSQLTTSNNKNLSIKEFFTSRLMRAKSFEGGAHSPKDETTNWFDEFKARMTKRNQKSSIASSGPNYSILEENHSEESNDSGENLISSSTKQKSKIANYKNQSSSPGKRIKYEPRQQIIDYLEKNDCDIVDPSLLTESFEEISDPKLDGEISISPDISTVSFKSPHRFFGLRERRLKKISCVNKPDFDTASVNTIIDRRDSRYDKLRKGKQNVSFLTRITSALVSILRWIFLNFLPFNYTLPWKLICTLNFAFVIIVIGLITKSNPDVKVLNFMNGFVCGVSAAFICFIILFLSIIIRILPESRDKTVIVDKENATDMSCNDTRQSKESLALKTSKEKLFNDTASNLSAAPSPDVKGLDDYSVTEILNNEDRSENSNIHDENYKGWMIEFVGDYELRHKAEIKLKLLYVRFDNRVLYLYKVKSNRDIESSTFPSNVQQRKYDLKAVRKFAVNLLFPKKVRNLKKWLWSKKYPIRIEFSIPDDLESLSHETPIEFKSIQLTLFTKTCREKEEWFRRFKQIVEENRLAQVGKKIRNSLSDTQSTDSESIPTKGLSLSNRISKRQHLNPATPRDSDGVQMSQSSHLIGDLRNNKASDDSIDIGVEALSKNLVRTKSFEMMPVNDHIDERTSDDKNCADIPKNIDDGNTLTQANADLFSQAVDDLNFIESRPNMNYLEYIKRIIDSTKEATSTSDWFNSLTGRIFFDVFSQNYWSVWFKRKIQRKLYRIRLPYFMETLTLTSIDLGSNAPQFLNVVSHQFDSFGLSIDFDVSYAGGLTMTFETKLNLLKIRPDNQGNTDSQSLGTQSSSLNEQKSDNQTNDVGSVNDFSTDNSRDPTQFGATNDNQSASASSSVKFSEESATSESSDSDLDSSSDSSSGEADIDEISDWEDYGAERTRQNIVRFVDRVASSRYFQQAAENRYIKKKLQDISNCPLVLVVQIQSLNGVLTLNVPPPQTDRIWYGFRPNPDISLKALPKMGEREVSLSHVTDWIERKLEEEFRKILVIPNMEDIVLPVLKSDHLLYVTPTK